MHTFMQLPHLTQVFINFASLLTPGGLITFLYSVISILFFLLTNPKLGKETNNIYRNSRLLIVPFDLAGLKCCFLLLNLKEVPSTGQTYTQSMQRTHSFFL